MFSIIQYCGLLPILLSFVVYALEFQLNANKPANYLKGGQLVVNGKQSACGLAVIDSKAAVVAADCIDTSNPSNYSVYLDMGITGVAVNYTVESIAVHPNFNPSSLANNLAVLQYNSQSNEITWQNTLGIINVTSTDDVKLVYYRLANIDTMTWEEAMYVRYSDFAKQSCRSYSSLYKANVDYFLCSGTSSNFEVSNITKCRVPHHTVYFQLDQAMYISGLLSYSIFLDGTDFCSAKVPRMYYTLLGPYIGYLKSIIKRDIKVVSNVGVDQQKANEFTNNVDFQTNQFAGNPDYNVIIVHGDFFNNKQNIILAAEPETSTPFPDKSEINSQTASFSSYVLETATSNTETKSSNHVAKGVIVGVCIGTAGLASICGALYFWRWKRKQSPGVADPMRNNDFQNMLESSRPIQANVGDYHIHPFSDYDLPPLYEEVPSNPQPIK